MTPAEKAEIVAIPWLKPSPGDDQEAEERYDRWIDKDPFPDIPSALLGSAAFCEYIRVTSLVHPFRGWNFDKGQADSDLVKPASYEMRPGRSFFIFDEIGNLVERKLASGPGGSGEHLIRLPANSITFVSTEETFRLPNYIAVRFNLRIKHVHRGILLGTGPLIDPGYNRPILIPLHNLTDADHFISVEEGLIWVEFTKTYPAPKDERYKKRTTLPNHTRKDMRKYLFAASGGMPIRSSITDIKRTSAHTTVKVDRLQRQIRNFGYAGIVALILTAASLLLPTLSLVMTADTQLDTSRKEVGELKERLRDLEARTNRMEKAASGRDARNGGTTP